MNNKITVVTVTFNAKDNLEKTILSVINQNDIELEYIIIDGGSNDGTIEIINKYKNNIFYCESTPDRGIYDAMNKSLKHATGNWIIFMNAGDIFFNNYVLSKIFSNILLEKSKYDIVYGNHSFNYKQKIKIKYPYPLKAIWKKMPICHQSIIMKTKLLKNYQFNLKYKFCADYFLIYSAYLNSNYKLLYINENISTISRNGFSESNSVATYKEYMNISLSLDYNLLKYPYFIFKIIERIIIDKYKNIFKYNNE